MHHTYVAAIVIFDVGLAGIWQTGFLFYWKPVQLGSQHHRWPSAVFQDSHYARPADMLCNFITKSTQPRGQRCCSLRLMRGKFRVLVQIKIQSLGIGNDRCHLLIECRLGGSTAPEQTEDERRETHKSHNRTADCRHGGSLIGLDRLPLSFQSAPYKLKASEKAKTLFVAQRFNWLYRSGAPRWKQCR